MWKIHVCLFSLTRSRGLSGSPVQSLDNEEGFLEVLDVDGLGHHDLADWYTARWGLLGDKPEQFSLFNTSWLESHPHLVDLDSLLGQSPDLELGGRHGGEVHEQDALVGPRHAGLRHTTADACLHLGLAKADLARAELTNLQNTMSSFRSPLALPESLQSQSRRRCLTGVESVLLNIWVWVWNKNLGWAMYHAFFMLEKAWTGRY